MGATLEQMRELRTLVWNKDIPSPSVPEYEEHHRDIQIILKRIDQLIEENYKWYFTFGGNHSNAGKCQPIMANDYDDAREKMCAVYGTKWGFQYSYEEWNGIRNDPNRNYDIEEELRVME